MQTSRIFSSKSGTTHAVISAMKEPNNGVGEIVRNMGENCVWVIASVIGNHNG